ncbi:MAG: sigma 54-interacting transcriptional regulator [Planctomycetota bacterium]|nr:sigma 54-interacting transcriptional regulator [Planctomycetota bacterium]MDA1138669.1 sigma 54-interacting transcriptional regulator [Planctomycetota bacterium]
MSKPSTIGELKSSGWQSLPVKDEVRKNLLTRLRNKEDLFPGIIGYEETVIPQIENALLSRHDILFLGLRGQAKSRMIRSLVYLLDEEMPAIKGSEIHDHPYEPSSKFARNLIAEHGDKTQIEWIQRDRRYGEKLATPDVTIADLIGETDLIKVAEGRHLADELTMHFGLIPRCNRGIFAINELPDLSPKIQVGLFNILEERDIQVRGYNIRMPLDVLMVFSANPEDYTNRGRIVTPLKDRIGSVVLTHYPRSREEGIRIVEENAWLDRATGPTIEVPYYLREVVEEIARQGRISDDVNQASGVSVRMSISNMENLFSSVERRALLLGEDHAVARISDLRHVVASSRGKIELEVNVEGAAEDEVLRIIMARAVKEVFSQYFDITRFETEIEVVAAIGIEVSEEMQARDYVHLCEKERYLDAMVQEMMANLSLSKSPQHLASAVEFVLEGLHVNKRLNKNVTYGKAVYEL